MKRLLKFALIGVTFLFGASLSAQEAQVGKDLYIAERKVVVTGEGLEDLFATGLRVDVQAPLTGNAYLAARKVRVEAAVSGLVQAAAQSVSIKAPVDGDVLLFAQDVSIAAKLAGDLRVMAQDVEIDADVAQNVIVGATTVTINAEIGGDLVVAAQDLVFGPNAKILGKVQLVENDKDGPTVPASVAAPDDVEIIDASEWEVTSPQISDVMNTTGMIEKPSRLTDVVKSVTRMLFVAALICLAAWIIPKTLRKTRDEALARPLGAVWLGFMSLSAALGSVFILALTGVGLLLVPVAILLSFVLAGCAYLIGTYVLGAAVFSAVRKTLPTDLKMQAIAALIGSILMTLVGFIPWIGWLVPIAIWFLGAGGIVVYALRPKLYGHSVG